jgi:REP element-mobilizing transposase RayT
LRIAIDYIIAVFKMAGGVQMAMDFRVPNRWGGARKGAGRKKSPARRDPIHGARPAVSRHQPQHVVLRTVEGLPRLRTPKIYEAIRVAMAKLLERPDFRVVQMSIQHNHLHFVVEAEDKDTLSHGMRALAIRCARAINNALGRTGRVFAFRYHATAITSPRQMRHLLSYVLNNWRHHQEDKRSPRARQALVDPYSSALDFAGWKERFAIPAEYGRLPVARAETWLMNVGWKRHGPISVYEVPGTSRDAVQARTAVRVPS